MIQFKQTSVQEEDEEVEIFEYQPVLGIELYIQMEDIMKQSVYLDEQLN
jgi:hypothetical protein